MSDADAPGDGHPAPKPSHSPDSSSAAREPSHRGDDGASDNGKEEKSRRKPTLVARYGRMKQIGEFRCNLDPLPRVGHKVVVRTERGAELGDVVAVVDEAAAVDGEDDREESCADRCESGGCHGCISPGKLNAYVKANGSDYPFRRGGKVLRAANHQDEIDQRHLDSSAGEEATYCREQIRQLKLPMKLVTVEHLLGGERIIFYFSAESRVDFRELVRRLAGQYRTRIEMRQVGARDEARLVGDLERCGRQCCCQGFLKDLKPVSMRMAKTQKATLDPSKISGRCGRLMCCLRYEDKTYEQLRKKLPHRNVWVRTETTVGRVVDTQILTQLVRLQLPDRSFAAVANDDIVERDIPESKINEVAEAQAADARKARQEQRVAEQAGPSGGADKPQGGSEDGGKKDESGKSDQSAESSGGPSGGESGGKSGGKSRSGRRKGGGRGKNRRRGKRGRSRRKSKGKGKSGGSGGGGGKSSGGG